MNHNLYFTTWCSNLYYTVTSSKKTDIKPFVPIF